MKTTNITPAQIGKIKTLMSQKGLLAYSEDLATSFTDGRTPRVSQMNNTEAWLLIKHLEEGGQPTAKTKMQRKILSLAHEQNWKMFDGKIDMKRVNDWCIKYGYLHKKLNDYTESELPTLVTQFEKAYGDYLNKV